MMSPDALLDLVRARVSGDLAGTAICSGPLAALGGELICGERFEAALVDERRGRALCCDYRVTPIAWVKA